MTSDARDMCDAYTSLQVRELDPHGVPFEEATLVFTLRRVTFAKSLLHSLTTEGFMNENRYRNKAEQGLK